MADLIKRRYLSDVFPSRNFNFLWLFLFRFLLFLLSFFLLKLDSQVCKLKLNHIINHFLNLILNFRQNSLFYLPHFRFVFRTNLIFPLFGVLFDFLLDNNHGFSGTISRVIFLEFIFFRKSFLLLLSLCFGFLLFLGLSHFQHHLLFFRARRNLDFVFLIELFNGVGNLVKLIPFHKLTNPKSSISEHLLFHRFLPFLIQFIFQTCYCFFILFLILSLDLSDLLSVFIHLINCSIWIVWILRFFYNS